MRNFFIGKAAVTTVVFAAAVIAFLPTAHGAMPALAHVAASPIGTSTPIDISSNAVIVFLQNFWQQDPILFVVLLVLGFPEVIVLTFAAILAVQFGDQLSTFINTAIHGNNPYQQ